VTEPVDLLVFKPVFISLRLPYSVKRFEQLSIVVVIFNYGKLKREVCLNKGCFFFHCIIILLWQ